MLNGCKFGKGTPYSVGSVQIQSYNVQAGDDQNIMADELNMKQDTFQPTPIIFEIGVQDFKVLPHMQALASNVQFRRENYDGLLNKLAAAWRGDAVRRNYGQISPLRYCRRDGREMVWYGRPRKFQSTKASEKSSFYGVNAEFQRADTLVYEWEEEFQIIEQQADPVFIERDRGDCDSWIRILGYGPLSNPVITIGDQQIALNHTIGENEVFEISSYPWQRRAVDSNGLNIAAKLVGDTQYLDRLKIPSNHRTPVRWTASNVNTWVPALENTSWSESIQSVDFYRLGTSFTQLSVAPVVVHFDLLNVRGPSLYMGGTWIGATSAVIYNRKQFGSGKQYCEARLVEPWMPGGSGIVITSNAGMTNFAMIEARTNNFGSDSLRIHSGTSHLDVTMRDSFDLGRDFNEYDVIGIEYNSDTKRFQGYLNGQSLGDDLYWIDHLNVVNPANRHQGFIFDVDSSFLTRGTGFADILAYDKATVPLPVGGIVVGWQNAYSSLEG